VAIDPAKELFNQDFSILEGKLVAGTNLGSAKSTIEMALDQGLIMGLIEGIAGIYNGPRLRVRVVWKVIDSVTI
jgi:hypothetical protein